MLRLSLSHKMAKRKLECSLNELIVEHLKKTKCHRTLKMFDESADISIVSSASKTFDSFCGYLKSKPKSNDFFDDALGFEINFGAYQPEPRLQLNQTSDFKQKRNRRKTEDIEQKIEVPKKFIKKIKKLGLREEDAEILYRSKINWTAVYSDNKIHCAEPFCDFVTEITCDTDDLRNHGREVHKYGEYPCTNESCSYVGFSKVAYRMFPEIVF